jgi:hypothetical protein
MNANKKTKNIKVNKAIDNMEFTNSFDVLKASENKSDNNTTNKKKNNGLF